MHGGPEVFAYLFIEIYLVKGQSFMLTKCPQTTRRVLASGFHCWQRKNIFLWNNLFMEK